MESSQREYFSFHNTFLEYKNVFYINKSLFDKMYPEYINGSCLCGKFPFYQINT